ncbi:MAG: acyltransferase family protein [Leptospirales bacterium]
MNYRPDIDGLRTLAVFGVILFHAGFQFIPGGFVGVDIFFTISGYLISSIIISKLEDGTFRFSSFFIRRIRRLFPALLTVIIFSSIAGVFIFNPDNLLRLSKSAIMAIVSLSNFHFSAEIGYWDIAAEIKPLLHTWSLSVEEQFYLVWPLSLFFIYKSSLRKNLSKLILALLFLSIGVTTYFSYYQNEVSAFYIAPFRAYEFLLGALLYLHLPRITTLLNTPVRNTISILGLALILISFSAFNQDTVFPGYLALIPCLGTFFILSTPQGMVNNFILSNKPMVWFGKISYSLYLVHWPIFAFYKYYTHGSISMPMGIILILSTILFATFLFYFIESPLRQSRNNSFQISDKFFSKLISIGLIIFFIFSGVIYYKKGIMKTGDNVSLDKIINTHPDQVKKNRRKFRMDVCNTSERNCNKISLENKNILIIGDSHGIDGYNIMKTAFPDLHFILKSRGGCPPIFDLKGIIYSYKDCSKANSGLWRYLRKSKGIKDIVISMRLSEKRFPPTMQLIKKLTSDGYNVVLLGVGPSYSRKVLDISTGAKTFEEVESNIQPHLAKKIFSLNNKYKSATEKTGATYIDKINFFCPKETCSGFTKNRSELVTYDKHHLSLTASIEFGNNLLMNYPDLF